MYHSWEFLARAVVSVWRRAKKGKSEDLKVGVDCAKR